MKIKSKITTVSAVAVLALTFTFSSFAAPIPFSDLGDNAARDKILSLQEKGLVSGVGGSLFAPDTGITAAQSIQLIVKALDLNLNFVKFAKEPKATDYFQKADNTAWYAKALIIAAVNSMDLPSDLDLNAKWTREEFTYRLVQAAERHYNLPLVKIAPPEIKDMDVMTVEYTGTIQRALIYGITELDPDGNFKPKDKISRAQAAGEVYNVLEYINAQVPKAVID